MTWGPDKWLKNKWVSVGGTLLIIAGAGTQLVKNVGEFSSKVQKLAHVS